MTAPADSGIPLPPPHPPAPPAVDPAQASPEGDITGSGTAASTPPGTLRQILTPVRPARAAEPIGTTTALAQTPADPTGRASAGSKDGTAGPGADGTREGAMSALVRALAERWRRTGTTTSIKRQHDVKETRVSGRTATITSTNKSDRLAKHENSGQHRTQRDAKTADLNNKTHQHQHQGRDQRDHKKTDTTDAKNHANRDHRTKADTDAKTADTKTAKADTSAASKTNRDTKSAADTKTADTRSDTKAAKTDTSAKTSGDDKNHRDTRSTKTEAPKDAAPAKATDTSGPKPPPAAGGTGKDGKTPKTPGPKPADGGTGKPKRPEGAPAAGPGAGSGGKPGTSGPKPPGTAPNASAKGLDSKFAAAKAFEDQAGGAKPETKPTQPTRPAESDGAGRDAKPPAPEKTPAPPAAAPEAAGQDTASPVALTKNPPGTDSAPKPESAPERKKPMPDPKTPGPDKPKPQGMEPVHASTADLAKTPATDATVGAPGPVPAPRRPRTPPEPYEPNVPPGMPPHERSGTPPMDIAVGANDVTFTPTGAYDYGDPRTMSRGEVRTLRAFENRLAEKRDVLTRVAEDSKTARKYAEQHADRAQYLAEQAKTVKGGDALLRKLHRLAESARELKGRASSAEQLAASGAEAVTVLAANAETRHGPIYQAVVDSPLTTPAERGFYSDQQGG
ncbi:hypothetical protein AB0O91_24145 [Kitasatospora sp. NPDC089797]|uniref:hypothetical protein n=1 Tax=Kitasatospora sp. NPDC089797 TaxID=3155298 RepID=UPI003422851B